MLNSYQDTNTVRAKIKELLIQKPFGLKNEKVLTWKKIGLLKILLASQMKLPMLGFHIFPLGGALSKSLTSTDF